LCWLTDRLLSRPRVRIHFAPARGPPRIARFAPYIQSPLRSCLRRARSDIPVQSVGRPTRVGRKRRVYGQSESGESRSRPRNPWEPWRRYRRLRRRVRLCEFRDELRRLIYFASSICQWVFRADATVFHRESVLRGWSPIPSCRKAGRPRNRFLVWRFCRLIKILFLARFRLIGSIHPSLEVFPVHSPALTILIGISPIRNGSQV
jgi:hypothetical protein